MKVKFFKHFISVSIVFTLSLFMGLSTVSASSPMVIGYSQDYLSSALDKTIAEYNEELKSNIGREEKAKVTDLLKTAVSLKRFIPTNSTKFVSFSDMKNSRISTGSRVDYVVLLAMSWLSQKGYVLAKELLLHAYSNNNKKSTYKPHYGYRVKGTKTFNSIIASKKTSGSTAFKNSGSNKDKDCYYALHKVNYTKPSKNSKKATIKDYYDYVKGDYNGITAYAVNLLADSQKQGYLVPYYVSITYSK